MITVFADQYLYKIKEIVPEGIDLNLYDPGKGLPEDLDRADALLVRTVTKVNCQTLSPLPGNLKFLATGSAGTDHVDKKFLEQHGIEFAYAPGCNARAVAEYVVSALFIWAEDRGIDLAEEKIGIVGAGYVGSALRQVLDLLQWPNVAYDPPRALRDPSFKSAGLSELMNCSILTLHTPLAEDSDYPTRYWLDEEKLNNSLFKLVITTARGGVVKEAALIDAMESGKVEDAIIDVWENEPLFDDHLAQKAFIATPHIAGYSVQSKFRASRMIVEDMIDFFDLNLSAGTLKDQSQQISLPDMGGSSPTLSDVFRTIHPITSYDSHLHELIGMPEETKKSRFASIRTSHPYGNEFIHMDLPEPLFQTHSVLKKLFSK